MAFAVTRYLSVRFWTSSTLSRHHQSKWGKWEPIKGTFSNDSEAGARPQCSVFKKVYFAGVQRESGAGRISGECQFIEQERSFESFSWTGGGVSFSRLRELLRGKERNDVSNKASLGFETSIREHVYQNQCKENLVRSVGIFKSTGRKWAGGKQVCCQKIGKTSRWSLNQTPHESWRKERGKTERERVEKPWAALDRVSNSFCPMSFRHLTLVSQCQSTPELF